MSWLSCVDRRSSVTVLFVRLSHILCFRMVTKIILDTNKVFELILVRDKFEYNLRNQYVYRLVCAVFVT